MTAAHSMQKRDLHVVERVLKGDAEVYRLLVERYRPNALAYAHAMVGNAEVAEANVDKAFLTAFNDLPQIPDRSDFQTFFYRTLRKQLALAAASARADHPLAEQDRKVLKDVLEERRPNPSAATVIRRALLGVRVEDREAWALRYIANLSTEEASVLIGTTPEEIERRIRRAEMALDGTDGDPVTTNVTGSAIVDPAADEDIAPPALPQ